MATTPLIAIDLPEVQFRPFLEALQTFIKAEILHLEWLGVKTLKFRAELRPASDMYPKGGFEVIAETNKALNQGSTQQLRYLIRGFRGGWKAAAAFDGGMRIGLPKETVISEKPMSRDD
jgi:hypothetical protein